MAKLKVSEKAIVLGGILEKHGYKVDLKHNETKETYFVECPDFVFMLAVHGQQDGYLVHVTADAALAIIVMESVNRSVPGLCSYGPFARDPDNSGQFVQGEAAMEIKKSLIMFQAYRIVEERKAQEVKAAGAVESVDLQVTVSKDD